MSASEMRNFCMHLGLLIGDLVPEDNLYWQLYLKLREIVSLLISVPFDTDRCNYLDTLVSEHHEIYVALFGHLIPKFHFMLHYKSLIEYIGVLYAMQTLRYESKHREMKTAVNAVSGNVNISKTIATKYMLRFAARLMSKEGFKKTITSGKVKSIKHKVNMVQILKNHKMSLDYQETNFLQVQSCKFRLNQIIVTSSISHNEFPEFSKIIKILIKDNHNILFICQSYKTISYHSHLVSYEIKMTNKMIIVINPQNENYRPLSSMIRNEKMYVVHESSF